MKTPGTYNPGYTNRGSIFPMTGWVLCGLAGCILLCLSLSVLAEPQKADSPVIIVSPRQTPEPISKNALRAMFGMRLRNWPNQIPVHVFVLRDDNPTHSLFTKQILNIYPHQLRLAWDRLVFSGTGQAPNEVSSEEEMREKVAKTPGAIGYLPRSMVNDSVRILPIQ